jgi:hypothetical protein
MRGQATMLPRMNLDGSIGGIMVGESKLIF